MSDRWIPLFPLRTVLFPDGPLPLRVFEPRYLDMVGRCMRDEGPFGVTLLLTGSEIGAATMASVGTLARIVDWYQGSDGILGVTAIGTERFRVTRTEQRPDGLYVGAVTPFASEPVMSLPADYRPMAELLRVILDELGKLYGELPRRLDDATWVGCRFAEILPMPLAEKQRCLELTDPLARLRLVRPLLRSVRTETTQ